MINAAEEPAIAEASLLGAEVEELVAAVPEDVREVLADPNVKWPSLEEVKDALLKVVFRCMAVPVPEALATLVMLIDKLVPVVVAVELLAPPSIEKRPVQLMSL